jgi:hypothetical protein
VILFYSQRGTCPSDLSPDAGIHHRTGFITGAEARVCVVRDGLEVAEEEEEAERMDGRVGY